MGRDKLYPEEWTVEVEANAIDLLKRVNNLLDAIKIMKVMVTSGFRPRAINTKVGGTKKSLHASGKAIDLSDLSGDLKTRILQNPHLLLDFGLWMEAPENCPTWCHLDTGLRTDRLIRTFKP